MRACRGNVRWYRDLRDVSGSGIAPQALEVRAQVGSGLIAQRPILFQALVNDPFQFCGDIRVEAQQRTGRAIEDGLGNDSRTFAAKKARVRWPSHRARRRTRTGQCEHPVPWLEFAQATYRQSFPLPFPGWSDVLPD